MAKYVRLDAGALDADTLALRSAQLHARGLGVIAGFVDDHEIYHRCKPLALQAVQGRYLLLPEQIVAPVLTPNRMNLLRLMNALQENNPGPVELGEISVDPELAARLASLSGGVVAAPDEASKILPLFGAATKDVEERKETTLWDNWVMLAIAVTAATAEWILRRRGGLV